MATQKSSLTTWLRATRLPRSRKTQLRIETLEHREMPAGNLTIQAFGDLNEDGSKNSGEPAIAGTEISLYLNGQAVWSGVTTTTGELSQSLAPAAYTYFASAPDGYSFLNRTPGSSGTILVREGSATPLALGLIADVSADLSNSAPNQDPIVPTTTTYEFPAKPIIGPEQVPVEFQAAFLAADAPSTPIVIPANASPPPDFALSEFAITDDFGDEITPPATPASTTPASTTPATPATPSVPATPAPTVPTTPTATPTPPTAPAGVPTMPASMPVSPLAAPQPPIVNKDEDEEPLIGGQPTPGSTPMSTPGSMPVTVPATTPPASAGTPTTGGTAAPANTTPAAVAGALRVTSGSYRRHYVSDGNSGFSAYHLDVTVTGTVSLEVSGDGRSLPTERVTIKYSGWSRYGLQQTNYDNTVTAPARTVNGGDGGGYNGLAGAGIGLSGYGIPDFLLMGSSGEVTRSWSETLSTRWRGDYVSANGATYQFAHSYDGANWWNTRSTVTRPTPSVIESILPYSGPGKASTERYERSFGNSYREDYTESDQSANLPDAPSASAGSGITDTLPNGISSAPTNGGVYFNRTFAAGRTTGFTTQTTETNANEEVVRSPEIGHTEWSGTSARTYYFKNAWQVGDRNNAANPAEDRYTWLIDYADTGEYHGTQELDFPNEGDVLRTGAQTTDAYESVTVTKDVSEFTQQSHRAKNGNIYDGTTIFKRSATAPISSVTETHAVETYQNNFKPELSSQTTTSKTSGGYRSSLELKGNYTQINRDAAGLRQGATTGNYWSLTSQETNLSGENGGPSTVTASWNMDSPNTPL